MFECAERGVEALGEVGGEEAEDEDAVRLQERVFAAKPATVKIKTRALKKLKDAAR